MNEIEELEAGRFYTFVQSFGRGARVSEERKNADADRARQKAAA